MSGNLCEHCTAACCRYVALPIDEPDDMSDFDDIRWYLLHENVSVFREDGDWFISFATPCRHLRPDHGCGIYETRPQICRKYTSDNCDYHSGDYGWDVHFTCPEHLDTWLKENPLEKPTKRAGRKPKPNGSATNKQSNAQKKPRPGKALAGKPVPPNSQTDIRGTRLPKLPTEHL